MSAPENQIRIDPLTGLRSIVAPGRAVRPGGGATHADHPAQDAPTGSDPFAEGNEHLTPPEVDADRPPGSPADGPGWRTRVVPNLYPCLTADAPEPPPDAERALFAAEPARGAHEVIVSSPKPVTCLADLDPDDVVAAAEMWRRRMRVHAQSARSLHLSVNEGAAAGASLPHSHAQLFVLGFVPALVARERERYTAHATRTMGGNLLEDLVQTEVRRRERIVAIDDEAVCLAPWASRSPYQLMLAPRAPRRRFEDDGPTGARLLHDVLSRLKRRFGGTSPALNLWVRTAPADSDRFCWRIDIQPRLTELGGLEHGTGVHICTVAPETAAAELRDA